MPRVRRMGWWAVVAGWLVMPLPAAEFIFINGDSVNEGLNDSTVVAAVGGNTATTRGAQRLAALRRVGEIWGRFLVSTVPIRVLVNFDPLAAGTLAGASAVSLQENFTNAPKLDCWYPVALANSLAGRDLEPVANDISVTANSNGAFYYGLDGESPGDLANFVDVLLHELGHGLGFASYSDDNTGAFYSTHPDIFTTLMHDQQFDLPWTRLTAAQRISASTNEPYLVWNGPFTNAGLPQKLPPQSTAFGFQVATATTVNGALQFLRFKQSGFGPAGLTAALSGPLVNTATGQTSPADPLGACIPLTNSAAVAGKIALIRRGICDFDSKVYNAQQAGAIAVIIVNNVTSPAVINPGGDSLVNDVPVNLVIPSVMVSKVDGDRLITAAAAGTARASFTPIATDLAGTMGNLMQLYAPATLSEGSSVSHWSTTANPDLLMEPFINPSLDRELDLTLTQMKDIGWKVLDIPFPHLTYQTWKAQVFRTTDVLTNPDDDPDRDGVSNLEEYFFGQVPKTPDAGKLPTFRLTQGRKELVFSRFTLAADLVYRLEKSTNLVTFFPAVEGVDYVTTATTRVTSEVEQVTMEARNPAPTLFFRLRISQK